MRLISHCLTPVNRLSGILSLIRFGNLSTPSPFSALPPAICHEASPKAISERTSYIRVRLEFLRYPHFIPYHFNESGFGPPWSFTFTSTWTWIGHPVSGRIQPTKFALLRLAFASAPSFRFNLAQHRNSPVHSSIGTPSHINVLWLFVSIRFQVLFHSAPAVLFTFPSLYWFTIGH